MEQVVQTILKAFEYNRSIVEKRISLSEKELSIHQHSLLCFPWSHCRKLKKAVEGDKKKVVQYQEAEKDLVAGKYMKAIEILDRISHDLEETPWEVAMRVANTPKRETQEEMLQDIISSPSVISSNMKDARNLLIELHGQNKEA